MNVKCPYCDGDGYTDGGTNTRVCHMCGGSGFNPPEKPSLDADLVRSTFRSEIFHKIVNFDAPYELIRLAKISKIFSEDEVKEWLEACTDFDLAKKLAEVK